jgi:hypothetical protein
MSTHSPGPWVFDESDHSIYCGDDWPCVASFSDADLPSPANGRLMAAAPELLEALELMLSQYGCSCGDPDCDMWNDSEIAREAIRKARDE